MQHINTLIPRTQYYKAVFMARYPPVYGVYLCHHYPHPWHFPPPAPLHHEVEIAAFHDPVIIQSPDWLTLPQSSSSWCPDVSASPNTSDSWPHSPLSLSENNGNDISSFLSGSNCNDQLLVACAPYAPPCPQNCRVMQWKMQSMRTENTRLIS